MNFLKTDGTPETTDSENIELITQHFDTVYNNNETTENIEDVFSDIGSPRPKFDSLDGPPTIEEVTAALRRMKNDKASGPLGIPAEALKALSNLGLNQTPQIISRSLP